MRISAATIALVLSLAGTARAQVPAGGEFQANTYTTLSQVGPRASISPSGDFVLAWSSQGQVNGNFTTHSQRFRADGAREGGEFRVDTGNFGSLPALAHAPTGRFVVAWNTEGPGGYFDVHGRQFTAQGAVRGAEFTVNTLDGGTEYRPDVAPLFGGGFVVVWSQYYFSGSGNHPDRIAAQRYDAFGARVGGEMEVNTPTVGFITVFPKVSSSSAGGFVVTWVQSAISPPAVILARAYDPAGSPVGPPFAVESNPLSGDDYPGVAMRPDGGFVVAWQHENDGGGRGIRARLFSPAAVPLGGDFAVNSVTAGDQQAPFVAADRRGNFVVAWSSGSFGATDVVARRFDASGTPRGSDFQVNTFTTGGQYVSDLAVDEAGNFTVAWSSSGQDGSGYAAMARRFGGLLPTALAVDTAVSATSDGNGVLEPGEAADVRPSWRNVSSGAQAFTGAVTLFGGPPGPTHTVADAAASYGTVASGTTGQCSDCYVLGVSAPVPRPVQHWDGVFHEDLAPDVQGQRKVWRLHVGDTFTDVPRANIYYRFVETLIHNFITAGCTTTQYCPQSSTTREQMAVFVLVARDAAGDAPPVCTTPLFADVPASSGFCRWIEELARRGVVAGCGGGNFCPTDPVTREQMAVFISGTFGLKLYGPQVP